MDPVIARKTWRTLEPIHGAVYFVPEALEAFEALGTSDRMMGYFGSRSAPMGAVAGEVVVATFFNFRPKLVLDRVPAVWAVATASQLLDARLSAADAYLRRLLGADIASPEMAEAARLARKAAEAAKPDGRPLFAGHVSLDWPDEPHLVLWHAITLLREYRGDGHITALVAEGLDGCEALVTHAAAGEIPAAALKTSRAWTDDEWDAAVERLRSLGWVDADANFTDLGRQRRQAIEDATDRLAVEAWSAIGEDGCARLRELGRPWSKAIVSSGELGFR